MATAGEGYVLLEAEQDRMPVSWMAFKWQSGDTKLRLTVTHMYTAKLVWPVVWLVRDDRLEPWGCMWAVWEHKHATAVQNLWFTFKDICYHVVHVQCDNTLPAGIRWTQYESCVNVYRRLQAAVCGPISLHYGHNNDTANLEPACQTVLHMIKEEVINHTQAAWRQPYITTPMWRNCWNWAQYYRWHGKVKD